METVGLFTETPTNDNLFRLTKKGFLKCSSLKMVINKGRHFRRPICVNIFREACILDGSTLEKRPSPSLSLHSAETQPPLYKFVHISHRGSAQRRQPPQRGPRGGGTQRRRLAWREPRGGGATPRNRGCASPQCLCSQQRNSSGRGDLMAV